MISIFDALKILEEINLYLLIIFILSIIFEVFFNGKIFLRAGIIVYKKTYNLKENYLKNHIGKEITKGDVFIKVKNEYLCSFYTNRTAHLDPLIYGYLKIVDNKIITVYKVPFSYIFIIIYFIINITFAIIYDNNAIPMIVFFLVICGIATPIHIGKLKSIKMDVEYFIDNGK